MIYICSFFGFLIYYTIICKLSHRYSLASKHALFKPKGNYNYSSKHGDIFLTSWPVRWVIFTVAFPTYHTGLGHSVD